MRPLEEELCAVLRVHPEIHLCLLFGSPVSGSSQSGSDVDIADAGTQALSPEMRLASIEAFSSMAEAFEQLERLGVISVDLAARMKRAVGFRNIAVHAYQKINRSMVFSVLTTRLEDFRSFAASIARASFGLRSGR